MPRQDSQRPDKPQDDRLFRVAFESSPSGMVMVGPTGAIILVNREMEKLFGYSREELLGKSIEMLVPQHSRPAHPGHRAGFSGHPQSRSLGAGRDLMGRRRDGTEVPVEIGLNPIETDDGLCVLASVVDVSARKRAEQELKRSNDELEESEARYRLISETSFDGIAVSEDGVIQDANTGFGAMFGYTRDELIGRPLEIICADESRAEVRRRLANSIIGKCDVVGQHRDGRKLRVEATANEYSANGRKLRVTAVRDVTARHSLERQFQQAQKMEAIGRLAGGVAHDFNNLLTVILSYSGLVLAEASMSAGTRDDLDQIRKAAESAATLTRQLLAFSRQQVIDPKPLDLNEVVRDAERMLGRVIGEDIELSTVLGESVGRVLGDFGQMEQVIMNLAVNARDAMPAGGRLTIETANYDLADPVEFGDFTAKAGAYIRLAVRDTGTGMDDETKSRIFEPFFTTKEAGKGTGLGLATVFGIVRQNRGYITVDSTLGVGTTFNINLPRSDAAPARERERSSEGRDSRNGNETVLVVEDVTALREIVCRVLADRGYTVLDAVDASAALARIEKFSEPIHLLLTDVVLPGMNGRELAERVKRDRPDVQVLFMSGYTDDAVVRTVVLDQGVAFLQKPFTAETLSAKVRDTLE